MSATLLAYVANDNRLQLGNTDGTEGLRDADGTYINDATVVCAGVVDADGNAVSGDTFPKTLTYVADSDGIYRGTLQQTLALEAGQTYTATITVDGGGLQATFDVPFTARARTTR